MARKVGVKVVLVTCGSRAEARKIAHSVVASRLAACVNVVSAPVESVYRWQDRVETAKEFLLVVKTTTGRLATLEKEIVRLHSYELPEFLVLDADGGAGEYLRWLTESVQDGKRRLRTQKR
jgi:periplasmic divalent cation tolerance protein